MGGFTHCIGNFEALGIRIENSDSLGGNNLRLEAEHPGPGFCNLPGSQRGGVHSRPAMCSIFAMTAYREASLTHHPERETRYLACLSAIRKVLAS